MLILTRNWFQIGGPQKIECKLCILCCMHKKFVDASAALIKHSEKAY